MFRIGSISVIAVLVAGAMASAQSRDRVYYRDRSVKPEKNADFEGTIVEETVNGVKIKPQVELYRPGTMCDYARLTGWALARAHARSGDPALLSGYVGGGQHLADALADFALAYERQNAADHQALLQALRDGRLEAVFEGA